MPELLNGLRPVRARLRWRAALDALAIGGAAFAALMSITAAARPSAAIGILAAVIVIAVRWRITLIDAARSVEASGAFDNLVLTAAELEERPRPVRAEIGEAIARETAARLSGMNAARAVPLVQPALIAVAVIAGCVLLGNAARNTRAVPGAALAGQPAAAAAVTVRITPPPYTRRPSETIADPVQVMAIGGSAVRIESGTRVLREWIATSSESLALQITTDAPPRFLSVIVIPDAAPVVRIHEPGRDTALAAGLGTIAIAVDGRDDLGLLSLALRYTRVSGGGENVSFTEGSVPVAIEQISDREWRGRAQWTLDGLELADGDALVYRAVVRDRNPAAPPVQSDAFLIEIGRASEIASAGFALPSEERKYAISQQMVIYKTEQLLLRLRQGSGAARGSRPANWLEETRLIGMEQRMVRAEVIFLSGGEVQDEVEEAAHSHELAEGRLENQGRAEMLRAINFMSRAEAQLNDGRAEEALVLERQALASLERALDRRRYFLRTLPDRSRIDATRRLTGDRREARPWLRDPAGDRPAASVAEHRSVMNQLLAFVAAPPDGAASMAARVAALDPASAALGDAAVGIATARTPQARRQAAQAAMQAITAHALEALPAAATVMLPADPLAGRLAVERKP